MSVPAGLRRRTRAVLSGLASGAAMLAFTSSAAAFSSWGHLQVHQELTTAALSCAVKDPVLACFEPGSLAALLGGVGSPDLIDGDPDQHNPIAHCDNGDWLGPEYAGSAPYPQLQATARGYIQRCLARYRVRAQGALAVADQLAYQGKLTASQARLTGCQPVPDFSKPARQTAKCFFIGQLGRALHLMQDFYSHSNWVDLPRRGKLVGLANPPGLGKTVPSNYFAPHGPAPTLPDALITGCYVDGTRASCDGAVPHGNPFCPQCNQANLSKDDARYPRAAVPRPDLGFPRTNGSEARRVAIEDTRRQWQLVQDVIRHEHPADAELIICAITRDSATVESCAHSLALGYDFSCGLRLDGTARCWGDSSDYRGYPSSPPGGAFTQLNVSHANACGIRASGVATCWQSAIPSFMAALAGQPITQVAMVWERWCWIRSTGAVTCFPAEPPPQSGIYTPPPGGRFTQIAIDHRWYTCGLRATGAIECWGRYADLRPPPAGVFTQLDQGDNHMCALRSDGVARCWGYNNWWGQSDWPTDLTFTQISAGEYHNCGVRPGGSVLCWGSDEYGESDPSPGKYVQVAAGPEHTCGLRTDGTVACWGRDWWGEGSPPSGVFK